MATAIAPPEVEIGLIPGQGYLLADFRARTLAAIAGCVAGDTLIDTPSGSWPIKELLGFHDVLALTDKGIEAAPAFIFHKGDAQLYKLTLENGQAIEATADHYLLVENDHRCLWASVGELMQTPEVWGLARVVGLSPSKSVPVLQESTEEYGQSIPLSDVQHYWNIASGYRGRCLKGCGLYDPRPRFAGDNAQAPFPLSVGAPECNQSKLDEDGQDISQEYNHLYQPSFRPSRNSLTPLPAHDSDGECCVSPYTCGLFQGHGQEPLPSHKLTYGSQSPSPLDGLFQSVSNSYAVPYYYLLSLLSHTLDRITSIEPTTVASYYDMVVPKYHNYLAQGMVHHNTGGGKTQLGYWWLKTRMEMYPGYAWGLAEPTYPMLSKIILTSPDPNRPDLVTWLRQQGFNPNYHAVDKIVETDHGKVYLGSADNPDSMQGAAVKGYWLDEAGLMSLIAYQTALQRVSLFDGQVIITTTPYNRGWLKTEVYDKAEGDYLHVEKWTSIDNPAFPKHVYEEMQSGPNAMQPHRFRMMYKAEFERPVGMIYSSFNSDKCVIPPFKIPASWPRYVGQDYGPVHTAVIWFAKCPVKYKGWPEGTMFGYREYLEGNKSIEQHTKDLKKLSKGEPIQRKTASGLPSERQWRREFMQCGWNLQECRIKDVEMGIDKVWALHSRDGLVYFNTMRHTLSQKEEYRRKLDESQQPTDVIDNKSQFHFMDAERYGVADLAGRRSIYEA